MSDSVEIQFQTTTGDWITSVYMQSPVNDVELSVALKNVKSQHPNARVRAVDANGRLLDLLA